MMTKIYKLLSFLLVACLLFSCGKDNIAPKIGSTLTIQALKDTFNFGEKLNLNLIVTPDIKNVFISVTSVDGNKEVHKDTIVNDKGGYILSKEIQVPADGSWAGAFLITASTGGAAMAQTDSVYFKMGIPDYYLVGGSSSVGWEPTLGVKLLRFSKDDIPFYDVYGYFTKTGDGLKVLPSNVNWDGGFGMLKGTPGSLSSAADAENIAVPADGFYRLRLHMQDLTDPKYDLVASKWAVIGDATIGGWSAGTPMKFEGSKGSYVWTITTKLLAGMAFKFRENDAWDVNLGTGDTDVLVYDGGNITVGATGNYTISLKLDPTGYTYTMVKQ